MSGKQTTAFDPKNLVFTHGIHDFGGYMEDATIEITFNAPQVTKRVGVLGDVEYTLSHDMTCQVKVSLLASSPSNDYLSGMVQAQSRTGIILLPALLKDGNGATLVPFSECIPNGYPAVKYGKSAEGRVWTMEGNIPEGAAFIGGSGPSGIVAAALGALGL